MKRKSMRQRGGQPVVPSKVAVAASLRSGAGKHGGTARQKNRRDRRAWKLERA